MANHDVPEHRVLSLDELKAMTTFAEVDPKDVFGMDDNDEFKNFSPCLRAYFGFLAAIKGAPLASWGKYGMHKVRRLEFLGFEALAKDLSQDEKVRLVRIFQIFLLDIKSQADEFLALNKPLEIETLVSLERWIYDMLGTMDDETMTRAIKVGILQEAPLITSMEIEDGSSVIGGCIRRMVATLGLGELLK